MPPPGKQNLSVMKLKKSEKSNLESKKSLFFEIGLTIALAMALVAFEWATPDISKNETSYIGTDLFDEVEQIQRTHREVKPAYIPPPTYEIVIVDDTKVIIDETIDWGNVDIDGDYRLVIPELPDELPVSGDPIYFAEKMPQYRGGDLKMFHNHMQEIVLYPQTAIDLGLQGKVFVQFVVDEKGNVVDVKLTRKIDPLLDNAVLAAIRKSEKWVPGEQAGRKVKVSMSIPISFLLN